MPNYPSQALRFLAATLGLGLLEELWDAFVGAVRELARAVRIALGVDNDSRLRGAAAENHNLSRHGERTCAAR